ncbi:MAG: PorT family protein [Lachnoclostridium sp.]|nr:PorT family protein [Lachnoclostridium sp.]
MKKVFLLFCLTLLLSCLKVYADDWYSTPPYASSSRDSRWVVRAGMNVCVTSGKTFSEVKKSDGGHYKAKLGYDFSASFNKPLSSNGLFWGLEVAMGTRGLGFDNNASSNNITVIVKSKLNAYNFRYVPWFLGYRKGLSENFSFEVRFGPYFSYDFAGSEKTSVTILGDHSSHVTTTTKLNQLSGVDSNDGYQDYDLGLQAGLGFWYKQFNFDIAYDRGLISYFRHESWYSNNIMIRLGYAF